METNNAQFWSNFPNPEPGRVNMMVLQCIAPFAKFLVTTSTLAAYFGVNQLSLVIQKCVTWNPLSSILYLKCFKKTFVPYHLPSSVVLHNDQFMSQGIEVQQDLMNTLKHSPKTSKTITIQVNHWTIVSFHQGHVSIPEDVPFGQICPWNSFTPNTFL